MYNIILIVFVMQIIKDIGELSPEDVGTHY